MAELLKLLVAAGLMTVTEAAIFTLFSPFLDFKGYVVQHIGILIALFSIAQLFTRVPTGLLYRRQRGPWLAALALIVFGASTAGYAFNASPVFLVLWTVLHGLAFGVAGTILLALAFDVRPERYSTGTIMGWYTALLAGGHGVGNSLSGIIADVFGFGTAFLVAGALQIPAVVLVWLVKPPQRAASASPTPAAQSGGRQRTLHALRNPGVLRGSLVGLYMQTLDSAINAFFPLLGLQAGLSLTTMGLVKTVKNTCATTVRLGTGAILQRIPLHVLNGGLIVAFAVAAVVMPFAYGPLAFALIFVVVGICRGLLRATSAALLVEGQPEIGGRRMGVASGVYNSALDIGGIVGPIIAGLIAGLVGIAAMFQIMGVGLLLVAIPAAYLLRRTSAPATPVGEASRESSVV